MSDDLVKRLWQLDMHPESAPRQAADRIEELEARAEKAEAERHAAIAALSEEGRRRGEAEAKRDALREALRRLLSSPAISDGDQADPEWGCSETYAAEINALAAIKETDT